MVYWRVFCRKWVLRVGREKDMMEVTRWTVSTTARRRRSLNNYSELINLRIILTCEKCAVSAA
jgi:hypothetical protein